MTSREQALQAAAEILVEATIRIETERRLAEAATATERVAS